VALTAAAIVGVPLTTAPLVWFALFILVGAGRAVGVLANAFSTVELSERGVVKRGTASALMSAGGDLGSIAAPILAGIVGAQIGIGPALQVLAVVAAIVGTVVVFADRR
jgi:MFS family permease